jgi:hypothetical protein
MNTPTKPRERETVVLTLRDGGTDNDPAFAVRLRGALKVLLRSFALVNVGLAPASSEKPKDETSQT